MIQNKILLERLNKKLDKLLKFRIYRDMTASIIMSEVCLGLSDVCIKLAKYEERNIEKTKKNKKLSSYEKQLEKNKIKTQIRSFEKRAKEFNGLAKLFEEKGGIK